MKKISPFLWFDNNAEEAVNYYVSAFIASGGKKSKVGNVVRFGDAGPGPKGTVMTVPFQLEGLEMTALNGGPVFKFTPAISFFVSYPTGAEIDGLWEKLAAGGTVFMELEKYPFSEKFGWVQDKFGLSWQLNLVPGQRTICPFLLFVDKQRGKAEEAINQYVSIFKNSHTYNVVRFGKGEPEPEGTVKHASFSLNGQDFMAMDSAADHKFTFNEAVSFVVSCESQDEVDHFWGKLSQNGEEGQCGWLKDKFGVSWQIVPTALIKLLQDKDPVKSTRVMKAMLQMNKIDIGKLERAYANQ